MLLRHCRKCRVPVLRVRECPVCGGATRPVTVTPPGDIRPASVWDLTTIGRLVEEQYGPGTFGALVGEGRFALMNSAPALDLLDELILDGEVLGALSFDPADGRWRFLPRNAGAGRILPSASRGTVTADDGALKPLAGGGSLLAVGVPEASREIEAGDEVLVVTGRRQLVGVGRAKMGGEEMVKASRDMAVKLRQKTGVLVPAGTDDDGNGPGAAQERTGAVDASEVQEVVERLTSDDAWSAVLAANAREMEKTERKALKFIRRVTEKNQLPPVVSFSGGKDSLACLLLVKEAGISPTMLFLDTGLEFPATVTHVQEMAESFGTPLVTVEAGDAFWRNLPYFGPPGRDFRWCCKTCKLGPASRAVAENFPGGMLAFIGQRSYESVQRSRKSAVWENPWVKGQVGASPIQEWTAFHVWLYIRSKGAEYNPLYDMGFSRIGCYLCPATSLAELDIMGRAGEDGEDWVPEGLERFRRFLDEHGSTTGRPAAWSRGGFWRWKTLPPAHKELLDARVREDGDAGVAPGEGDAPGGDDTSGPGARSRGFEGGVSDAAPAGPMTFRTSGGLTDCDYGLSLEGAFDRPLPMDRVAGWLAVTSPVVVEADGGEVRNLDGTVTIYREGAVVVKGADEEYIRETMSRVRDLVLRAAECAGCGACLSRCPNGAMLWSVEDRVAEVDQERCVHCGLCLGPCPVTGFRADDEFEL